MTNPQTLTSLAMLKVDIDNQHRSYVDYLSPFVIDVLNDVKDGIVSDIRVADKLRKRFQLQIPTKVVQHVLRRLKQKNYLTIKDNVVLTTQSLPKSSLSKTRADAVTHIQAVLNGLIEESKKHKHNWSADDANKAVIAFLGKFTVDCLRTYVFNTSLPEIPQSTSVDLYIVGKFIKNSRDRNDSAFESFIVLVKGLMYSNALLCPDLESLEKKFQNVTFYFDTPLVLNILGLQDEDSKRAAEELTALLIKLRGSVAVFAHTVQECQNIISFAEANIDNPRVTSRVLEEMRRSNARLSDLILAKGNIDGALKSRGIYVKQTPEYLEDFQIDESTLEEAILEAKPTISDAAVRHDINSIRSIFALRKGRQPVRLEDCGSVFVTLNQSLARAAYRIGKNHNSAREVSPAITAYSLANIAWLKSPVAAPLLPLHETLALSYAALEPSTDLFRKYVEEMDRLLETSQISATDHEILRLSNSAREELMELTLGDEHSLTASSIKRILENAKAAIIAEQSADHAKTLANITNETGNELSVLQQREFDALNRAQSAELQSTKVRGELDKIIAKAERQREHRESIYAKVSNFLAKVVILVPMVILLLGALAGSGLLSPDQHASDLIKFLFSLLALIAVVWGGFSWYSGATVKTLELSIGRRIVSRLRQAFDPSEV